MLKRCALAGGLVLSLTSAAYADYSAGLSAYETGSFYTAFQEFQTSAKAGDAESQYMLARLYAEGKGTLQDYVEAHKWANLAAARGHTKAGELRDRLAERMTQRQIAEAQTAAGEWKSSTRATTTGSDASSLSYSVANVQQLLNDLGYDAGPVDGIMGSKTRSAIRAYQTDQGLPTSGQPSRSLFAKLQTSASGGGTASGGTTTRSAVSSDLVADIQSELRRRGYEISAVDGRLNEATGEAIRRYQSDAGLTIDGYPTQSLLASLRTSTTSDSTQLTSRELVRRTQAELNKRGYDAGPADGALGPKTRSAIRTYQSDAGVPVTGQASASLLAQLEGSDTTASASSTAQTEAQTAATPTISTVLEDDFSDGNYNYNPPWTVHSGSFRVEAGMLQSDVAAETDASAEVSPEDFGKAILRNVLNSALGGQAPTPASGQANQAEISTSARMANAFRIELRLKSQRDAGRIIFGPYQGGARTDGYRLAYASGDRPSFELVSLTSRGVRVVDSSDRMINLEDGKTHTIDWRRNPDGEMIVLVDGSEVLRTRDRTYSGPFSGLTVINAGGTYGIETVKVEERS